MRSVKLTGYRNVVQPLPVTQATICPNTVTASSPAVWQTQHGDAIKPTVSRISSTHPPTATPVRKTLDNVASREPWLQHTSLSFCSAFVWCQSLHAFATLLSNTAVSIVCVWVINYILSRGNFVTGRSASEQSAFEYFAAVTSMCHGIFYVIIVLTHVPVLRTWQFAQLQTRTKPQPSSAFCFYLLLKYTYKVFIASCVIEAATIVAIKFAPLQVRQQHVVFYVSSLWMHLYNTATSVALRRVFLLETVPGQLKRAADATRLVAAFSSRTFWKTYVLTFPKICAVWTAAACVQVASALELNDDMHDLVAFTVGSIVLKLVMKVVAKTSAVRLHIHNPLVIFVIAGLPTVLVDTQVRIMVQKMQSNAYTLVWAIAMAAFEVAARATRIAFTRRQIRRKHARVSAAVVAAATHVVPRPTVTRRSVQGTHSTRSDSITTWGGFAQWRRQILMFQIAESYANMSAEYIAIGCSTSILYFYWGHPKYAIGGALAEFTRSSVLPSSQLTTLGIQVLVELAVDYVSCVFEIAEGVDFAQIQHHRMALAVMFVSFAVVNVQLCAVMYLRVD